MIRILVIRILVIRILVISDQDTSDQDTGDQDTRPQKRRYSSEALDSTDPTERRYPLRKRQLTLKGSCPYYRVVEY